MHPDRGGNIILPATFSQVARASPDPILRSGPPGWYPGVRVSPADVSAAFRLRLRRGAHYTSGRLGRTELNRRIGGRCTQGSGSDQHWTRCRHQARARKRGSRARASNRYGVSGAAVEPISPRATSVSTPEPVAAGSGFSPRLDLSFRRRRQEHLPRRPNAPVFKHHPQLLALPRRFRNSHGRPERRRGRARGGRRRTRRSTPRIRGDPHVGASLHPRPPSPGTADLEGPSPEPHRVDLKDA